MATVRIGCSFPNGLTLQLTKKVRNEAGFDEVRRCGPQVVVAGPTSPRDDMRQGAFEVTEVDAEFWAEWIVQNEKSPVVVNRALWVEGDEPAAA